MTESLSRYVQCAGVLHFTNELILMPASGNVLSIFQRYCQFEVQVAQTVVHFQVQARKRGVLGGVGGVLCTYISPKGLCDG